MTARRVSDLLTGNNNHHLTRFLALATQQCAHREPVFTALLPQEVCLRCLGMKVDNISKGRMMGGLGCTQGVFHNRGSELSDRLILQTCHMHRQDHMDLYLYEQMAHQGARFTF